MSPLFWKGRRVFITGHTGFKGSWLSLWLQELGAELTGYALAPNTNPSLFELAKVENGMHSVLGDIRNIEKLKTTLQNAKPEVVIHMAAQPLVRVGYEDPVTTYSTNVMGTVNLFESVRASKDVRAVVNVTTDKVYQNRELNLGYRENEPMGGLDPYSSSKGCSELVTNAYRNSYFLQSGVALATARAGNVIGGGDWAEDRLVPDIFKAFEKKQKVLIRNPHAVRPWQHVLEPLSGYLTLAEYLFSNEKSYADGWNFGPNSEDARPVQWIVEQLASNWGEDAAWQQDDAVHPHEENFLKLDISKAKAQLGWRPTWSLEGSLQLITQWHRAWLAHQDVKKLCLHQIHQYYKDMQIKAL